MIRLKQKKANEEKKAAEEKAAATAEVTAVDSSETAAADVSVDTLDVKMGGTEADEATEASGTGKLKLLGIGGVDARAGANGKKTGGKKRTPGEIRIQKGPLRTTRLDIECHLLRWLRVIFPTVLDISDLDGGTVAQVEFPNPNDLTNFNVIVSPDSGCWAGARYHFTFAIPPLYPHEPPKVTCNTKIYHPNINLAGNVCLNILREDWKPVLDINAVIYGLIYLFYEPNPDDPLNREAADLYRSDKTQVSYHTVVINVHYKNTFL
jgi:ubiquitin-conjugating enzyme E2 M